MMGMNAGKHQGKQQFEMDILTEATYLAMAEKQAVLDAKIKEKQGIEKLSLYRIELAYRIEAAECVNEMKGDVKYWSKKKKDHEKFLEELVDALHFVLSFANHAYDKKRIALESYGRISKYFDEKQDYVPIIFSDELWSYAYEALREVTIEDSFACLLIIAYRYGYTEQDIIDTYNRKNSVNHDRSDSGVY